jgi:hypothetical protein
MVDLGGTPATSPVTAKIRHPAGAASRAASFELLARWTLARRAQLQVNVLDTLKLQPQRIRNGGRRVESRANGVDFGRERRNAQLKILRPRFPGRTM